MHVVVCVRFWMNLSAHERVIYCPSFPGTTCLVALLSDRELTVANVGDSRGVLCDKDGNAVALSHDHKPYQLKERKRIKRAGELTSYVHLHVFLEMGIIRDTVLAFLRWLYQFQRFLAGAGHPRHVTFTGRLPSEEPECGHPGPRHLDL